MFIVEVKVLFCCNENVAWVCGAADLTPVCNFKQTFLTQFRPNKWANFKMIGSRDRM
jgi:coproporphyrinogen III oxidase